jgi:putative ABC transport system substrate-binding protein
MRRCGFISRRGGCDVPPMLRARADEVIRMRRRNDRSPGFLRLKQTGAPDQQCSTACCTASGARGMRRRDVIALLGGAALVHALRPRAALAQQDKPMRLVAILMNTEESDPEAQRYLSVFRHALDQLGWKEGTNVRFETRWGLNDAETSRRIATAVIALRPDVVLAAGGPVVTALQRLTRTVPIVFSQSIDPVGAGFVKSLARPEGNATGFTQFEYSLSGKWPELLKEIAPGTKRVGVLRDATNPAGIGQWAIIQVAASALGMEITPLPVRNVDEIEPGIAEFARHPNGGLVVPISARAVTHHSRIIAGAARHRLPAVYVYRYMAAAGGLLSYGPDLTVQYRSAAGYVDRILKGEKPADLPVQAQTKYDLVINLKTAKALGIEVPPMLIARADEVIE